jgi:magnesium transporter
MIRYYYKSLRKQNMELLDEYRRGCWTYVEAPTSDELNLLVSKFGLERSTIEDALDEDEQPRLEKEDGVSYIFVRFAYRARDGEFQTAPLLFIFGKEFLVTVSLVHLPALDSLLKGKIQLATTQRTKLILQILEQISDNYDIYINGTSRQIKAIRSRLRGHEIRTQDFIDFVTIEDELNEFLSSLLPTSATLRRLLRGGHIPLYEEDQDIVEDLLLNNEQSVEGCTSNLKSIENIREAYTSISSHNLNQTIKVLTVATVMIALPNLFYGMYGMNVPLPFQHEPWSYWVVLGFSLFSLAAVTIYARRKKIF